MKQVAIGAGVGASLMAIALTTIVPQIQEFEGTKYKAYHDIGGILTVCTGHTGTDVVVNKIYTQKQCDNLTQQDAAKAAKGVLDVSPQLIYHPMQLAAAISFSYNVGVGTYAKSSVATQFNLGNFSAGCDDLLKYSYAGGVYSPGLFNRRVQERNICLATLTPKGLSNVAVNSK